MPTFRSISVHPDLQKLLATLDPPIETPQALLSRDPVLLAAVLQVPSLRQIDELRAAVADALISKTLYGSRALRVTAAAADSEKTDSSRRPRPLIVGATTALDLLSYQTSLLGRPGISSGSLQLDRLFSGSHGESGLRFGCVTQLTGPPGSCKTQLALALAKSHASSSRKVYYFASSFGHGTLYPLTRRLQHFCTEDNFQIILQNIAFTTVSNGHEALLELQKLLQKERHSQTEDKENATPALLILDSASGCLSEDLYASGEGGAIRAQQVGFTLRTLARHCGLAVLVTNGTVSGGDSSKAAMGNKWDVGDISLWLEGEDRDRLQQVDRPDIPVVVLPRKVVHARLVEDRNALHDREEISAARFAVTANGISDAAV